MFLVFMASNLNSKQQPVIFMLISPTNEFIYLLLFPPQYWSTISNKQFEINGHIT